MIGGGVIAAGELLLGAGARGDAARARCAPARDVVRVVPARFGAEAGMLGAARARVRRAAAAPADARPRVMAGRLVVCPTPIGNLEDVTLRVLAALREADVVACEDTRRTRVLLDRYGVQRDAASATTSTTSASGRPSWWSGCAAGAVVALVSDAGHAAGLRSRASCSCGRASPRGWRSRCCPGRRRRWPRWWRAALPADALALRRLPAAQARASCEAVLAAPRDARRVRVAAAASARRSRCWPSSTRSGRSRSAAS